MIIADESESLSPASSVTSDQEVSLLDQIKYVTYGHPVIDVITIASAIMEQCLVQMSRSREHALQMLDTQYIDMAKRIDHDYDDIRVHGALHGKADQ